MRGRRSELGPDAENITGRVPHETAKAMGTVEKRLGITRSQLLRRVVPAGLSALFPSAFGIRRAVMPPQAYSDQIKADLMPLIASLSIKYSEVNRAA